jgi:hypothetical protein
VSWDSSRQKGNTLLYQGSNLGSNVTFEFETRYVEGSMNASFPEFEFEPLRWDEDDLKGELNLQICQTLEQ